MAYSVTTLPNYVDAHKVELLQQAVFTASTVKYLNIQSGIKSQAALNILTTEAALQARACGWNDNGTATYTQRILTVGAFKINVSLCEENLRQKWMNTELVARVGENVLPFEEKTAQGFVDNIRKQVENLIWNATTSANQFDGLRTIAVADGVAAANMPAAGGTVTANVQALIPQIPMNALPNAHIFMGVDTFLKLTSELTFANLYHYRAEANTENLEIVFPGTNIKVVGVGGLNGTNALIAADPANLFYGVDMMGDDEVFDFWYSRDNQEFRLAVKFNAGTQIAFPSEVVQHTIL